MTEIREEKGLFAKKPRPRSVVYVDGFNLYNGSVKGSAHKWLNLQKYFELLRQHEDVVAIKYFTARLNGDSGVRQMVYLRALETLPKMTVIVGRYKQKTVRCHVSACAHSGDRRFTAWEEKRTDVSIAIQMVADAYEDQCDTLVVVSGDSDLVPALAHVKACFPKKKLVVYIPARDDVRGAAVEMRAAADKDATLPTALFAKCQFPPEI